MDQEPLPLIKVTGRCDSTAVYNRKCEGNQRKDLFESLSWSKVLDHPAEKTWSQTANQSPKDTESWPLGFVFFFRDNCSKSKTESEINSNLERWNQSGNHSRNTSQRQKVFVRKSGTKCSKTRDYISLKSILLTFTLKVKKLRQPEQQVSKRSQNQVLKWSNSSYGVSLRSHKDPKMSSLKVNGQVLWCIILMETFVCSATLLGNATDVSPLKISGSSSRL